MHLLAYSFGQAGDFINVAQALPEEAGHTLSVIMSDRTAAREFAPEPRGQTDVARPLGRALAQIARQLHPLAALGGQGSGLVGAGPALGRLHGLGLGSERDLGACLHACGVDDETVTALTTSLRQGGVLAITPPEQEHSGLRDSGGKPRELVLELPDSTVAAAAPVRAPAAPAGEQRAEYTPAFAPVTDNERNR